MIGTPASSAHFRRYFISRSFSVHPPQWIINWYLSTSGGNSVPLLKSNSTFSPVYSRIQFGSFTVPISSHWRWCVQPSQMRIRSPSESLSSALAPRTTVSRFPLYLANKIEKEVSGISAGVSLETFANAWLSVMTSEGFVPSFLGFLPARNPL